MVMRALSHLVSLLALTAIAVGQGQAVQGPSPREIVERLWISAAAGDLLTPAGLKRTSTHYEFAPDFLAKPIRVISDYWGIDPEKIEGQKASVIVGFLELGTLDSKLKFHAVPDDPCGSKDFAVNQLVARPTYDSLYGSDGKTLIAKKPRGFLWALEPAQGYRWATRSTRPFGTYLKCALRPLIPRSRRTLTRQ